MLRTTSRDTNSIDAWASLPADAEHSCLVRHRTDRVCVRPTQCGGRFLDSQYRKTVGSFRGSRGVLSNSSDCLSELHLDAASLRLLVVLRARASVDTLIDAL